MLTTKQKEHQLDVHRSAMLQKHQDLEERKRQEHEVLMEEHAQKAERQKIIRERVLANIDEDKLIVEQTVANRQRRALAKQARLVAEREAEAEQHRSLQEEKRENLINVRKQQELRLDSRKSDIQARMQRHDDLCERALERKDLDMLEHCRRQKLKEERNLERREKFKVFQEEEKQMTEERLRRKYEQTRLVHQEKQADLHGLNRLKQEFADKKDEMRKIVEEAGRTGNMEKAENELARLKQHKEEMESDIKQNRSTSSSPIKRRARSAAPSPSVSTMSPTSPGYTQSLRPPDSARPSSAPRLRSPGLRSPFQASQEMRAASNAQDAASAGNHYAHLMGLFKTRLPPNR